MPEDLVNYINQYGYLLLFALVFLQEIGVPSFPNEIVLYYFGYLSSQNNFSLILVLFIAIAADIIGTSLLYSVFHFFGKSLIKFKPSWLKISKEKIQSIQVKIISRKSRTILFLRITPFIRGYVSVFAGIMHFPFKMYFNQVVLSAILWTGGWVVLGWITNKYFKNIFTFINGTYAVKIFIVVVFIAFFLSKYTIKFFAKRAIQKKFKIN